MDIIFTVKNQEDEGKRADAFLASEMPDYSRMYIKKLIEEQKVICNNTVLKSTSYKVKMNDTFSILSFIESNSLENIAPTNIPLDIVYEDNDIIIVNKPVGLTVHPGAGNYTNTLVNALLYKYKQDLSTINGDIRAGIVHRLDKDTSGLLIVAKNDKAHIFLAQQFEERTIKRHYRALCWGIPTVVTGKIETFIARSKKNRLKMDISTSKGKKAITNYKVLNTYENTFSLVKFSLETGRTHQIRAHMLYKGYPLVGDPLYGKQNSGKLLKLPEDIKNIVSGINYQALHAYSLRFIHPTTKEEMVFFQQEPEALVNLYNKLFDKWEDNES